MKTVIVSILRVFAITLAMTLISPLVLPGLSFSGSLLQAILLGSGMWLTYSVTSLVSKRVLGLGEGTCPHPSVMKILVGVQVVATIAYLVLVGIFVATPLVIGGIFSLVMASLLTLAGAIFSNVLERLLRL